MPSNVRSVTVRLEAMVARYIRDMNRAGDATEKAFDRVHASTARAREDFVSTQRSAAGLAGSLDDVGVSGRRANAELQTTSRHMDRLVTSTSRLNTSTKLAVPSQRQLGTEVDRVSVAAVRGSASIDRYSGRLRILGELLATLGPGLIPFGAGGVAALGGLAGIFGAATVGALALVGATQGVGDALEAVEKARLEPTVENIRQAELLMSRIAPEAREFVTRFEELRPVLEGIRDAGASEFFPGVTESLDSLERLAPVMERLFAGAGRAGGDAIARGAESLTTDRWEPFLDFLVDEIPDAIDNATQLLGSLSHTGAELWMAFDPTNDKFIDWLVDVADNLDRWSSSTNGQQQIQGFLAYAEKTGPKVADFFVAVADALTQIVQAAAPLSGPVLETLTMITTLLAKVADSDLGTPILAGVAALSLYNRALMVTAALQTKLTGSTAISGALASGGIAGASRAGSAGLKSIGADLKTVGLNWRYLGTSAALGAARQSRALVGMGKGAAVLGGLAIASTGAADKIGLTNTASLALMGTIAGPWGAAIGGGVGLVMDLSAAIDTGTSSVETFNAALASGDTGQMLAEIAAIKNELAGLDDLSQWDGVGDFFGDFARSSKLGIQDAFANIGFGDFSDTAGDLAARQSVLEGQVEAAQRAALAEAGFSDALIQTGNNAGFANTELLDLAVSTRQASTAAWGAFDAQTKLGASLDAVAEAAAKGKRGIDASTEGGRENRQALSDLAASWADTKAKMEENGASAKSIERRYREVRGAFLDAANAMGVGKQRARELAAQLDKPMTIIIKAEVGDAVARAKSAMAQLRAEIAGNPIVQHVVVQTSGGPKKAKVGQPGGVKGLFGGAGADGMTVPGPRYPYGDKVFIHAAPGEEIITNRNGEADRFRADRAAGRIPSYANGGTVGSPGGASMLVPISTTSVTSPAAQEAKLVGLSLKQLRHQLKLSEKSVEAERQQRDDLVSRRDSLVSGTRSGLDKGIWKPGQGSVWSDTAGDPLAQLRANIAEINQFDAASGRLKKVLSGDALAAILGDGDLATAQAYAGLDDNTLREFQSLYGVQQQRLNDVSGMVGDARYGAELAAQTKELKGANRRLDRIEDAIDRSTKSNAAEQGATRDSQKRGAGKASKSKNRGHMGSLGR